ncbi:hypothetical protein P3L10_003562 [Capsicum annuum]
MDSQNHPQLQPHHHQQQPPTESHELEQPLSDMVCVIVTFTQHQQPNLQKNPLSSISTPTPVVNQVDSSIIALAPSENLVKKPRGRPPSSGMKKQPETSGTIGICSVNHKIIVDIGERQFDIISLSGSFMRSENGVTGGLNLSITKPDGSLFDGVVEGKLRAATPV